MKNLVALLLTTLVLCVSCNTKEPTASTMRATPPKADKIAKNLEMHGDVRIDEYYWLNERENEEVIDYLERENDYYE